MFSWAWAFLCLWPQLKQRVANTKNSFLPKDNWQQLTHTCVWICVCVCACKACSSSTKLALLLCVFVAASQPVSLLGCPSVRLLFGDKNLLRNLRRDAQPEEFSMRMLLLLLLLPVVYYRYSCWSCVLLMSLSQPFFLSHSLSLFLFLGVFLSACGRGFVCAKISRKWQRHNMNLKSLSPHTHLHTCLCVQVLRASTVHPICRCLLLCYCIQKVVPLVLLLKSFPVPSSQFVDYSDCFCCCYSCCLVPDLCTCVGAFDCRKCQSTLMSFLLALA